MSSSINSGRPSNSCGRSKQNGAVPCCGDSCTCSVNCPCTESLCLCAASSVLNSVGNSVIRDDNNNNSCCARGGANTGSHRTTASSRTNRTLHLDPLHDASERQQLQPEPTTTAITAAPLQAEFWIDGMTCTMCSQAIERAVKALEGVHSIAISLATDSAVIEWDATSSVDVKTIQETIEAIGYAVQQVVVLNNPSGAGDDPESPLLPASAREEGDGVLVSGTSIQERWQLLEQRQINKVAGRRRAFLWSLLGTLPILVLTMILPHVLHVETIRIFLDRHIRIGRYHLQLQAVLLWALATPVQFLAGWEFYRMSFFAIFQSGRAGMDVLVALGTSASYGYALYGVWTGDAESAHFFETSTVLLCFVLAGKWMQALAVRRTSQALSQLMELQATTAVKVTPFKDRQNFHPVRDPYGEATLPIEQIVKGDLVKVIRGACIPADGKILFGEISVDESMVTGESVPVLKTPGSFVLGGTICVESSTTEVDVNTTRIGGDDDNDNGSSRDVGAAFVEVTGVGSATALAQIVEMVHEAQTRAVPIQSFADQVSAIFVPTVCYFSLVTFLVWYALCSSHAVPHSWYEDLGESPMTFSLMFAIACLVISCPCALGLATPTAVMVGTGVAAKIGVLMKGGEALEISNKVDSIVFDKTGTLTVGKPAVSDFLSLDDQCREQEEELLWLMGTLERSSEHPLARAVVVFAEQRLGDRLSRRPFGQPTQFRALTGRGATGRIGNVTVSIGNRAFAQALGHDVTFVAEECMVSLEEDGKTAILVIVDGLVSAIIGVTDQLKPDAAASIAYLRDRLGIDVWMVTGDNARTACAVNNLLGLPLERVIAEALPAAKLEQVRKLQAEGKIVAMVGDGVNDSPALAQADIGMSLGAGAEIANEASDIVLVRGNVADVCTALDLSRVIFRRIKWNFVWSLVYNCLGIPIAAGVFYPLIHARLPPTVAALAMALSSISVVLSSLTLRLYRPPEIEVRRQRSRMRSQRRRRPRAVEPAFQPAAADDMTSSLLENDQLEIMEASEATVVTEATAPTDNRTVYRMEEGE